MYDRIKDLVKTKRNIFLTGSAGTGKSYNLNLLRRDFLGMEVSASTGVAAVNVSGTTIHRLAGIGLGNLPASVILEKMHPKVRNNISRCHMLAIDEISMLSAETLDLINEVFKEVRNSTEPFGGMQLIVIGDFLQLPPVSRDDEPKNFAFESKAWQEANFCTVKLEKCFRQKDINFLEVLKKIRVGEQIDLKPFMNGKYSEKHIHLFALNRLADDFNFQKLAAIKEKQVYFGARDQKLVQNADGDYGIGLLKKCSRAPQDLFLKPGARVMLLINKDVSSGLVNGATGTVLGIDGGNVRVDFDNGVEIELTYEKVDTIHVKQEEVAIRWQMPLRLAYAITMHKSQGMTLKNVHIDGRGIFEYGQAYVAFSRVESPEGLHVENFEAETIKAHPLAVQFYEESNVTEREVVEAIVNK